MFSCKCKAIQKLQNAPTCNAITIIHKHFLWSANSGKDQEDERANNISNPFLPSNYHITVVIIYLHSAHCKNIVCMETKKKRQRKECKFCLSYYVTSISQKYVQENIIQTLVDHEGKNHTILQLWS